MIFRLFIYFSLFLQLSLSVVSASPIFDKTNSNMWLIDENSGQVTSYVYTEAGVWTWTTDFLGGVAGAPIYTLQSGEQVFVNNLANSSQLLGNQFAPISIADLGQGQRNATFQSGVQLLEVTPVDGDYTETLDVVMLVSKDLLVSGSMTLDWDIIGTTTGVRNGSTAITSASEQSDGRYRASFYLVKNDTYNITVTLHYAGGSKTIQKILVYNINASGPAGNLRDTDTDGLPDLVEMEIGLNPLKNDWQYDSDGNGWSDFDEWLRSDSLDANGVPIDSDLDGWSDFDENLRGTDPKDKVSALTTLLSDNPAPLINSQLYRSTLALFKDVPAANRLYEIEYVVNASVTEINPNTIWEAYESFVPAKQTTFNSDSLLTTEQLAWANAADVPDRRKYLQRDELVSSNALNNLRLAAGVSQILDIIGIESEGVTTKDRKWHLMHWLNSQADITPQNFAAGNSWTTAQEWKTLFINYLQSNLVQTRNLQVNQQSTTDVTLMLTLLTKEHNLAGGGDLPEFNTTDGMTSQAIDRLAESLRQRENGRSLDDVLVDIQSLSLNGQALEISRAYLENALAGLPYEKDYLLYLNEFLLQPLKQ